MSRPRTDSRAGARAHTRSLGQSAHARAACVFVPVCVFRRVASWRLCAAWYCVACSPLAVLCVYTSLSLYVLIKRVCAHIAVYILVPALFRVCFYLYIRISMRCFLLLIAESVVVPRVGVGGWLRGCSTAYTVVTVIRISIHY